MQNILIYGKWKRPESRYRNSTRHYDFMFDKVEKWNLILHLNFWDDVILNAEYFMNNYSTKDICNFQKMFSPFVRIEYKFKTIVEIPSEFTFCYRIWTFWSIQDWSCFRFIACYIKWILNISLLKSIETMDTLIWLSVSQTKNFYLNFNTMRCFSIKLFTIRSLLVQLKLNGLQFVPASLTSSHFCSKWFQILGDGQ